MAVIPKRALPSSLPAFFHTRLRVWKTFNSGRQKTEAQTGEKVQNFFSTHVLTDFPQFGWHIAFCSMESFLFEDNYRWTKVRNSLFSTTKVFHRLSQQVFHMWKVVENLNKSARRGVFLLLIVDNLTKKWKILPQFLLLTKLTASSLWKTPSAN